MKLALIILIFLSGCSSFPIGIKRNFPSAPPELLKQCEQLKQLEGNQISITDMLKVIVENYTLYYECSNKVDGWQHWHKEQKRIFDGVK